MRSIMAKYNYAFGYLKGFIFLDFGFAGIAMALMGIVSLPATVVALVGGESGETVVTVLIGGILFLIIGLLMLFGVYRLFKSTLKKCPQSAKPVALAFWMIIAGIVAAFAAAWRIIKLVFHMSSGGAGAGGKANFASGYYRDGDNASCTLWTTNLNYAILKDSQGNEIEVRKHGDGNLVIDNNGNLYRPW